MAKLTGPLLSFGARGQIGKTMVTASWRGVNYARQYVTPANPQTAAQTENRSVFAVLREMWKRAPTSLRAPWDSFALGRPFTGVNKYVGENQRVLPNEVDFANFIGSPGSQGGIGATAIVMAAGGLSGEIDVTFTDPDLPAGWTITDHIAAAFLDQAPNLDFVGPFTVGNDAAADPTITLAGLTPNTQYCVYGFIQYQKPNGVTAYSPSVTDLVTSTA